MEWLINKNIAHRGLHSNDFRVPENSLLAFRLAVEKNISIELDVHALKDGTVVVFHDDNLKRMTGVDKKISECTYEEIRKLKLLDSNQTIPLLAEVFDLVNNKVPILIEIKNTSKLGYLERRLLSILKKYNGRCAIQSFNPFSLIWFRINANYIYRGQLSSYFIHEKLFFMKKCLIKKLFFNFLVKPNFISYNIENLPNKRVRKIREKGIPIFGWTIRNEYEYKKAKMYCDSIIFENINVGSEIT